MKKKRVIRAEDILAEQNFSKDIFCETSDQRKGIDDKEILLAQNIYFYLTANQITFPDSEKEQLKKQIKYSARKLSWNKNIMKWSVAAAVLVICIVTGVWYFHMNSTSGIVSFTQTIGKTEPDSETRLILQNGHEIRIDKEESKIFYAQNGQSITIGQNQKVAQTISPQKQNFNTVIVPYGKRTFITLAEGTKVWLNSGSKLTFPAVFAENKREVYIDGEAIFEVTHSDKFPFYVKTRDFDVKVLGTVFNVCAYSDDKNSKTILERGKIELSCSGKGILSKKKLNILPGTMAVFNPEINEFAQHTVNPQDYMSWRNGYLVFSSEKLRNIIKKINRYYNVEIIIDDSHLQNETFSGNLDLKNTPEQVLEVIAQTTPINYDDHDDKIVITTKTN